MNFLFIVILFRSLVVFSQEITPTALVNQSITFADDLVFKNIELVVERQLKSFNEVGLKGSIKFGNDTYPKTILKDSLLLFRSITREALKCINKNNKTNNCLDDFNASINFHFKIYSPVLNKNKVFNPGITKFTSYFSPDFKGSRTPTERFVRPIYKKPNPPHDNYARVDIDYRGALAGKGFELFWVEESFFDLYLLHVQGGGRITIFNPDGTSEIKYISYAGKNRRPFQMISKYMVQKGYLTQDNRGVNAQRKFLLENPDKEEEIFATSPSYIYFNESDQEPVGLDNIPLTEGRSLAIDSRIYKTMGLINFVKTQKASHFDESGKIVKVPFSRFFIAQDTGGAIRGNARCDLYFGYGPQAEMVAYNMDDVGEQYFLIKK